MKVYNHSCDETTISVIHEFGRYEIRVNDEFYATAENMHEVQEELDDIEQLLAKKTR